jgi:hypothetical protein
LLCNILLQKKIESFNEKKQHVQTFFVDFKNISKKIKLIQENANNNDLKAIFIFEQIHNYKPFTIISNSDYL